MQDMIPADYLHLQVLHALRFSNDVDRYVIRYRAKGEID